MFQFASIWIIYFVSSYGRQTVALDCSNGCKVSDEDFRCWNETREYFLQQITDAINNFVGVESMINKWKRFHDADKEMSSLLENTEPEVISLNYSQVLNREKLTLPEVMSILKMFAHKTVGSASKEEQDDFRHFCPVPADYMNTLWIYLFVCSCIILTLTLVLVTFYTRKMQGEVKRMRIS